MRPKRIEDLVSRIKSLTFDNSQIQQLIQRQFRFGSFGSGAMIQIPPRFDDFLNFRISPH